MPGRLIRAASWLQTRGGNIWKKLAAFKTALYLHIFTYTGYRVCFSFFYTGIYMCTNIDDAIPLPGHKSYYCSKSKLYATQCSFDVLTISIATPLGKLHGHVVVDVLPIYPYHSVNSIDT